MKMLVTSAFLRDPSRFAELEQQHGIQVVVPDKGDPTPPLMTDVDAVYGQLTADDLASARQLRWERSPAARPASTCACWRWMPRRCQPAKVWKRSGRSPA